ncbi:class I SAM-dependent DNA methyltransferase [Corynebacterium ammoniagenes]|uniref:Methyltransferase domain protein n=1 Tax=Corynebacterium ammoniagenes DSM 20306 TaxID=649754 RepID=A0ABN0AD95_CORAM|nr:class I SAM-dependent methyltransferase [Corynebacterium ammoniagenes]APT82807.1 SAM-dependent methyltransferase [Corynebacterium ammoniagenes DSM 20306]AQS73859.1 SAM-dependent methyltransferase [Corynebacterium ammoniagenes]EFG80768.1 methyltransferase domain protein [Corynebacterium ammoniagenes DSM 20306]
MIDHSHFFDDRAAEWDKDPKKIERAQHTAQLILDTVAPNGEAEVFEFGAGTGLVSQFLSPHVGALTLADNSEGMRDVIAQKIEAGVLPEATLSDSDLVQGKLPDQKYDLVVASLVLHHVADVPALLKTFASILEPRGAACIIELDDAGGKFHAHIEHYDGHDGFKREKFEKSLLEAGFAQVEFHDAGEIEREDGSFSLFLANAITSENH